MRLLLILWRASRANKKLPKLGIAVLCLFRNSSFTLSKLRICLQAPVATYSVSSELSWYLPQFFYKLRCPTSYIYYPTSQIWYLMMQIYIHKNSKMILYTVILLISKSLYKITVFLYSTFLWLNYRFFFCYLSKFHTNEPLCCKKNRQHLKTH